MTKNISAKSTLIRQWLTECSEFTYDGKIIFCKICSKQISQEKKCHLKQHVQGAAHKAKAQQKNQLQQTLLTQPTSSNLSSNFYADLTRAFVAANIPWNAIENPVLRQFLQKYCKQNIPSESTLRKNYLDRIYNETLASIREDIGDSYIWVSVDETSDPMNRYIANMAVGKLSPDGPSIPHLVCVKELSKVNSQAIAYFVDKGLQSLYSGNIDDSKVLLFCTDAASYMVAAAPLLKTFYPNLTHDHDKDNNDNDKDHDHHGIDEMDDDGKDHGIDSKDQEKEEYHGKDRDKDKDNNDWQGQQESRQAPVVVLHHDQNSESNMVCRSLRLHHDMGHCACRSPYRGSCHPYHDPHRGYYCLCHSSFDACLCPYRL
ncbi:hypothetical protein ANN_17473, partial [Periplaneta americana]